MTFKKNWNSIGKNEWRRTAMEEKRENIGIKIGKCCFVGRLLMVRKNWDDIQIKFTENQKYTSFRLRRCHIS